MFSGMQPTAQNPHIGNYLGAFVQTVQMQEEYNAYYFIADLHAITIPKDPKDLKEAVYVTFAMLIAVGMDPKKLTLFVQSQNPFHTELGWILNCFTSMGQLSRMTQFKEKSEKQKDFVSVGLYDYPVLQAADVLLYDAHFVPVGEDQVQHVELMKDIALRINAKYGEILVPPAVKLVKEGARVMSLQDPEKKMSKSDDNHNGAIFLLDNADVIRQKVKIAVTDSERSIVFDVKRKGLYNLLSIYKVLSGKSEKEIEDHFAGMGYKEFKEEVAEYVINLVTPIQKKYSELIKDKGELERIMKLGAEKAIVVAEKKVKLLKEKIGFIL
ncbi:MAG: tryptophan--tRNA ligase [Patescibacteria group bacterium]